MVVKVGWLDQRVLRLAYAGRFDIIQSPEEIDAAIAENTKEGASVCVLLDMIDSILPSNVSDATDGTTAQEAADSIVLDMLREDRLHMLVIVMPNHIELRERLHRIYRREGLDDKLFFTGTRESGTQLISQHCVKN